MSEEETLDEIKAVHDNWKANRHKWRSSHAMVKISEILDNTEIEKAHLTES